MTVLRVLARILRFVMYFCSWGIYIWMVPLGWIWPRLGCELSTRTPPKESHIACATNSFDPPSADSHLHVETEEDLAIGV